MYEGHWHSTTQFLRICAVDGCVTQPPQVAVLERVAMCGHPVTLRTQWHEWMEGGLGIRSATNSTANNSTTSSCCSGGFSGCGTNEAIFRGYFPTFDDINPANQNKKVNLTCDLVSDVNKTVLILGYDRDGNWVRTNQGGTILDGELISLAQGAGTNSVNFYSVVTDVQLNAARDGRVWLYEWNDTASTRRMIGQYESFEDRPSYPRYFFPSIVAGTSTAGNCRQTLVEAMVKLNFWKVKVATDYLCVPCIPALKHMMEAINEAENAPDGIKKNQIISAGLTSALHVLNAQLDHFQGSGSVISMNVGGANAISLCPIEQLV